MKNTHGRTRIPSRAAASTVAVALLCALAALGSGALPALGQGGLKVHISVDMEGVVGAVTSEQLGPGGFEYQRFREFMTNEAIAAIDAARAAGATEIVVADSHGNGQNLLIERLPSDITLVRSWPRRLGMMEGIDDTFDAAIFIAYHSSTTNPRGVRAHTMSSANYAGVRINGIEMSEASINAALAGHFGVPVVMISGDDAIVEEARSVIGDLEGAVVKWSYGFHSARTIMPEAAYALIGQKVAAGLARLDEMEPYRFEGPIDVELTFKSYMPAEVLSYLPNVDRVDAHTVGWTAQDMEEVVTFFQFVGRFNSSLTP